MFKLATKEMGFSKVKYGLIGLILFLIASLVLIVSGLARGLSNDNIAALETMTVDDFYVSEDSENVLDQSGFLLEDLIAEVERGQGWEPLITQSLRLDHAENESKLAVTLIPVLPSDQLYPGVIEGEDLQANDQLNVVIDQTMKADGVSIGDTLHAEDLELYFTVIGFTENQTYRHAPVIYMSEEAFYVEEISPHKVANAVVLTESNEEVRKTISATLADGVWVNRSDIVDAVPGHSSEQMSLNMMIFFLIVISVFVLGAFFYILTIQKLNQFGVLKAIGAKNKFLIGTTLLQVCILTIISLTLAVLFTWFTSTILPEGMPFDFNLLNIAIYTGLMLIVSLLGALISSRRIIKVDPQQAMGRAE
ncbi:putative ABC transport system permease protein [Streptohalobacillus salinus]|uniref:Putative hemin transport system permease protein HrtB n=1 Tax=Streptohalobacillus salinus TaxID=621096 RepID=A0A2V3WH14_9BACI|nr:ABC transporter permease [Streptohalobacillus salinus]PXW91515.1 putative ABC transport system permease protein [Streptohalobacillus salinus]